MLAINQLATMDTSNRYSNQLHDNHNHHRSQQSYNHQQIMETNQQQDLVDLIRKLFVWSSTIINNISNLPEIIIAIIDTTIAVITAIITTTVATIMATIDMEDITITTTIMIGTIQGWVIITCSNKRPKQINRQKTKWVGCL
jgi:3-dehydroquinate dehydratase